MAYCTQSDIEAYTGYGYSDFKQAGVTMTSTQWANLVTSLIAGASQQINRFCNVGSFESTAYTEYHDGRGMTGDRGRSYREIDRTFLPHEQPVISVTSVKVDISPLSSAPSWTTMTPRAAGVAGQYAVSTDGYVTRIRFHDEVPKKGVKNVEITYMAGYASGHAVLGDIKFITMDIIANFLGKKKRGQEAAVVSWGTGTQDGANMVQMLHQEIFTEDIKTRLIPYRRSRRGHAWH
jgi:hypothetical protein